MQGIPEEVCKRLDGVWDEHAKEALVLGGHIEDGNVMLRACPLGFTHVSVTGLLEGPPQSMFLLELGDLPGSYETAARVLRTLNEVSAGLWADANWGFELWQPITPDLRFVTNDVTEPA